METALSEAILQKFNIMLQCNPSYCQKQNCPLWNEERNGCDALRVTSVINTKLQEKFSKVVNEDNY